MTFDWIDKDFMSAIVAEDKKLEESDIVVENVEISVATNKGDNFLATLLRVHCKVLVNGVAQECSYIVKTTSNDALCQEFACEMNVFPKEQLMYSKVIPELEQLWHAKTGQPINFGPRCLLCTKQPALAIVLEDLGFSGHKMGNRKVGVDLAHAQLVMQKLAKFHATSVVYNNSQANRYGEMFDTGMHDRTKKQMDEYYQLILPFFVEAVERLPQGEKYVEKIKKWDNNVYQLACKAVQFDSSSFNFLNHGDLWLNNVMFQYTPDGGVKDVTMIDFQLSFWGSPTFDLYYFLSSYEDEIRISKFYEITQFYHEALCNAFDQLQYTGRVLTLKELHIDLINRGFVATTLTIDLPGLLYDGECSIENLMEPGSDGDEYRRKIYSGPKYVGVLEAMMPFLFHRGSLDP